MDFVSSSYEYNYNFFAVLLEIILEESKISSSRGKKV